MNQSIGILRDLYQKLPPSWRLGRAYRRTKALYAAAGSWPLSRIRDWQVEQLKVVVAAAYSDVAGYRQLYQEAGVVPEDIRTLEDVNRLPFVTKELIRDNLRDFTSRSIPKGKLRYVTTGGSTGIPFGFHATRDNALIERAFMDSAWEEIGWHMDDPGAILRGGYRGSPDRLFQHTSYRRHSLSLYCLSRISYPHYRSFVERKRPRFLHAYPSSAADLAEMILENGDVGRFTFRHIFVGSENLYPWQRKLLASAFPDARVMHWYGHSECVVWAPWCSALEQFHLCPFYGHTEILGAGDQEVGVGQVGELVGTSFWMRATPFIRYRTMDYAVKGEEACSACGRQFQLLRSIDGRLREMVVSANGQHISMTAINMHDDTFDDVAQFRFVQHLPGRLVLQIVRKESYGPAAEARMRANLMSKLGADFELEVQWVDSIPRSGSGKLSFLEQHLPIDHAERVATK